MKKSTRRALGAALHGCAAGIAIQYIGAIIISQALKLGYFMPCITTLPEALGGEIRAVAAQAALFGFAGAGLALAALWARNRHWGRARRAGMAVAAAVIGALPALVICCIASRGL